MTLFLVCPTLSLLLLFFCLSRLSFQFFTLPHHLFPSILISHHLLVFSSISSIDSLSLALPSQRSSPKSRLIACRHLCKSPSCARGFLWTRPVGSLSLCVLEAVLAHLEKQGTLLTQRDCSARGATWGTSARTSCPAVSSGVPDHTSWEAGEERGGGAEAEGAWGEGKRS